MIATNHALTGAAIVLTVKQPALALPLAFLSHFILDAIPHFGIHEDEPVKRNGHWLFKSVVSVDVILTLMALIAVPLTFNSEISGWWILLGMFVGISPDSVWIYRFLYEFRTKIVRPYGRFAHFHQRIQWSEKPWGIGVELAWIIMIFAFMSDIA
jgi:hypothetical protein